MNKYEQEIITIRANTIDEAVVAVKEYLKSVDVDSYTFKLHVILD
jgi:hypothetical protein